MAVRNRIQVRRGYSMGYAGSPIPSGNTGYSYDPVASYQWTGDKVLYEGEIGYEVDTGKFKIGRKDPVTGNLIIWENLDYGGGGAGGTLIPGSGVGIYINSSGDDTIYSVLTNTDTNITIYEKQLSSLIAGTTGTYYELGLADNLSNINNITISGDLSADAATITNDLVVGGSVAITGDLSVSGTTITFDAATITLVNLTATSGNFTSALTVNDVPVSVTGHTHPWSDINNLDGFCDDVGDCVNTQLIGSSGVQFLYDSGANSLRAALSGEALAQHQISTTGFISRSGTETYVTRSIVAGDNIAVTNGDGTAGNPSIALSTIVTGLTSVTATTFSGNLVGNADTATQVKTQTSSSSNEHYLTFVDSDNGSATAETVYTDGGIKYIPSTDTLIVGNISGVTISGTIGQANTVKTTSQSTGGTYYLTFVDSDNSPGGYEAVYTDAGIVYNPSTNAITIAGDITASGATINNNLVVGGDLTVNGTTVTANVDSMVVEDPIITLGKPSGTLSAENKDRGIEFVYPSGTSTVATTGFFGFDKSATEFIAARDVTIAGEIITVNNNSYLDARFNDIDGSVITASSQFSGPGSGLSGTASNLTAGLANHLSGGNPGSLPYQTSSDTTTFVDIGATNQFLAVGSSSTPEWRTLAYGDISGTPTIGSGTLTLGVSGSGLSGSATFDANQTGNSTFTVTSNATHANTASTIVSRDSSGNFSAGTITANLTGTATNADNINVDEKNDNVNYQVLFSAADGTGYQRPYIDQDNAQFTYNPSTQTLTVANFAGNASTVTSGVYTYGDQTITGTKRFDTGINLNSSSSGLKIVEYGSGETTLGQLFIDSGDSGKLKITGNWYWDNTSDGAFTFRDSADNEILVIGTSTGNNYVRAETSIEIKSPNTLNAGTYFPVFTADPNTSSEILYTRTASQLRSDLSLSAFVTATSSAACQVLQSNSNNNGYEFTNNPCGLIIDGGTP